jgi:hypothetical protein
MAILVLFVFLVGTFFGMRFKVLILIPAFALGVVAVAFAGFLLKDSISGILLRAVLAWGALQLGYFCGLAMRHWIAFARHQSKVSIPGNQPTRAS